MADLQIREKEKRIERMRRADPDYEDDEDDYDDYGGEGGGGVPFAVAWSAFLRRQRWTERRVLGAQPIWYVWQEWSIYQLAARYGVE